MAEQNNANTQPRRMEDDILELFNGELKETALKFAADLTANRLTPKQWRPKCWKIPHNECHLCMIQLEPNKWKLTFFFGDYSGKFDEGFIKAVQENVRTCTSCHDPCTGGIDTMIFGKECLNACSQLTIQFENPNAETLGHIKQLLEYSKKVPPQSESWHAHH